MNKLIIKLFGGTGNQLFQFFFALNFSRINKCNLYYDASFLKKNDSWGRFLTIGKILDYYKIPCSSKLKIKNPIILGENQLLHPKYLLEPTLKKSKKIFILEGYFQNYRYIGHLRSEIQSVFSKIINLKNFKNYNFKNSVSLHIRELHNYLKNKKRVKSGLIKYNDNLSWSYYKKSLDEINKNSNIKHLLMFSDSPLQTELKKKIKKYLENYSIEIIDTNKKKFEDLEIIYLMSLSDNLIIANSTFSWWSAFISKSKIYCPVFSLWDKHLKSLDNWIQILDDKNLNPFTIFGECDYKFNKINNPANLNSKITLKFKTTIHRLIPSLFIKIYNQKKQQLNYFKKKNIL